MTEPILYEHRSIYVDASGRKTDAMLVHDSQIVALGTRAREVAEKFNASTSTLGGVCVMPALADAHIHLWGFGLRHGAIDLRGVTTTEAIYEKVAAAPETDHGWILGSGWDQHLWTDSATIDRKKLDVASKGRPVSLRRIDEHALWTNSVGLEGTGLPADHNGMLIDDVMHLVTDRVPKTDVAEDRETCIASANMLHRFGIASAHIAWVEHNRLEMIEELVTSGTLRLRVHPMLDGKSFTKLLSRPPQSTQPCAVKFFSDGALGSRGAHLIDPYPDGTHGVAVCDDDLLSEAIPRLAKLGWQVCIHAIGDQANRRVLSHYANLSPAERAATRPRVEHVQMLHDNDVDALADVIASIQPIHLRSDAAWVRELLTDGQCDRLYRWRTIAGRARLAAGSDYPIEDPNPWHGISTALTRLDRLGREFGIDQRLNRKEILAAYTTGAAYAAFWEDQLGALKPGMRADFITVDTDPFVDDPAAIWDTKVHELFIDGERCLP